MTAMTETITSTVVTTKAYDAANRLITVTTNGAARTLDWSDAGELLRDGDDIYQWDAAGRLISATVDGVTSRYAYLGDGGRISVTVGSETTTYTLDLASSLVQVLVMHESGESTAYLYGLARIGEYDGDWHYHLADHLGSVRSLVGADGNVKGTRAYRPYGAPLSSTGGASSIYGFTGEQIDPTGLIYLRARMYSPAQSQFLTRDPWKGDGQQPLTLNPYLYALGNPLGYIDPSGRSSDCPRPMIDGICHPDACILTCPEIQNYNEKIPPAGVLFSPMLPVPLAGGIPKRTNFAQSAIHNDSCGDVAIAMVFGYYLGHPYNARSVFKKEVDAGVTSLDLMAFREMEDLVNVYPHFSARLEDEVNGLETIRSFLHQGIPPIVLVNANRATGKLGNINPIGHWIVVSGLSAQAQWAQGPCWQWVKIVNPFDNQVEYYTEADFSAAWGNAGNANWAIVITFSGETWSQAR